MADVFSKKKRSLIMRAVKGKHTAPEKTARLLFRRMGFRIQTHRKDLPGKPDIVIPLAKLAVFLNGCFWHGHVGCGRSKLPTTNRGFWAKKISGNIKRDRRQQRLLKRGGWKVLLLWTCRRLQEERLVYRLKRLGIKPPVYLS